MEPQLDHKIEIKSPFPSEGLSSYYQWSQASWHLAWPPMSEEEFKNFMAQRLEQNPSWGIYSHGKLVGGQITEFMQMDGDTEPTSFTFHIALSPSVRGKFIFQRMSKDLIREVFRKYPSTLRCTAWLVEENVPVIKIVEGLGFKREGIMREATKIKGKITNLILYGLTKGDLNG